MALHNRKWSRQGPRVARGTWRCQVKRADATPCRVEAGQGHREGKKAVRRSDAFPEGAVLSCCRQASTPAQGCPPCHPDMPRAATGSTKNAISLVLQRNPNFSQPRHPRRHGCCPCRPVLSRPRRSIAHSPRPRLPLRLRVVSCGACLSPQHPGLPSVGTTRRPSPRPANAQPAPPVSAAGSVRVVIGRVLAMSQNEHN